MIFKGEITQACGNVNATNDPSAYGEVRPFRGALRARRRVLLDL